MKKQLNERIKSLEAEIEKLKQEVNQPDIKSKENRLMELLLQTNNIKLDVNNPDYTFGFADDFFLWYYNSKSKYLWLSNELIWNVLKVEYNLSTNEIQSFIKIVIESHFKTQGITIFSAMENAIALFLKDLK